MHCYVVLSAVLCMPCTRVGVRLLHAMQLPPVIRVDFLIILVVS